MTAAELPAWVLGLTALLSVTGAAVTLIGALGLIRLRTFYERVHAPTLGATLGMALVLAGSLVFFIALEKRFMPRELLIALFFTATTPVTLIILARAALFRDRTSAGGARVPAEGECD
ncbi:potassium:proton antiporter [Brevundimonas naejangsanensis]|uniref:Potassium:proton antiporter n=1 Tax=Brevundimonas naejangsanensis TaxID=588932 RepID=A0A494REV7_9CAUL|nr:monovalent cation/H(+) antiporter subunit G [Brevundimonas naejangsanensis]AYG94825.1 potassium:proton antiporter [Brevundimonas naejangsanensis]